MNHKCIGWSGHMLGHHFVTVYDERSELPDGLQLNLMPYTAISEIEALKTRAITVKSIHCTRCGEKLPIE